MGQGKRLKELLKSQKIAISSVAAESGIARTTLYSIVNRDSNIKSEEFEKIVSVVSVLTGIEEYLLRYYLDGYTSLDAIEYIVAMNTDSEFNHDDIRHPVFTGSKGSWLRESKLDEAFSKLNETGQFEAIKRVEELTEIEKYKKKD